MFLVPTFTWVRTNAKGEPNPLNSLLPPCESVEIRRKVVWIINVLCLAYPLSYVSTQGKEDSEGPDQATFLFLPPCKWKQGKSRRKRFWYMRR
jgi:hypothetical protein